MVVVVYAGIPQKIIMDWMRGTKKNVGEESHAVVVFGE